MRVAAAVAALIAVAVLSLAVGAKPIPLGDVFHGLLHDDGSEQAAIVRELRVPRTLVGLAVGIALGLAGALMQALTRNPLADPGLLGVDAGAAAAIVVAIARARAHEPGGVRVVRVRRRRARLGRRLRCSARAGAAGATPVRLALAGTAIAAALTAFIDRRDAARPAGVRRLPLLVGRLARRARPRRPGRRRAVPARRRACSRSRSRARSTRSRSATTPAARSARTSAARARSARVAITLLCGGATAVAGPIALRRPHGPARRARDRRARTSAGCSPTRSCSAPILLLGADVSAASWCGRASCRSASSPRSRRAGVHRARAPDADRAAVSALAWHGVRTPRDRVSLRVHGRAALVCVGAAARRARGRRRQRRHRRLPALARRGRRDAARPRRPGERVHRRDAAPAARAHRRCSSARRFGIAGAIFQSISRNPLGSPDVIGFTTGAATGALVVILLVRRRPRCRSALGAVAGGLATAVAVYLLALRHGVQGYRLVLVGIGVGAVLESVNAYLITRAARDDAFAAAHWLVGSLNGRGWEHVVAGRGRARAARCRPRSLLVAPAADAGDGRRRGARARRPRRALAPRC